MKNPINELNDNIAKFDNDNEDIQCLFYDTAIKLMNNYELQINSLKFELTEIEFYFFNCDNHGDTYVHLHDLQKNTNSFLYVHEAWGTYGGIDLTFGNNKYYGGILIRGIQFSGKYIAGPAKVRDKIVAKLPPSIVSYSALQKYFNQHKEGIILNAKDNIRDNTILHAPRHNLGKKEDKDFKYALYRFARSDYVEASKDAFCSASRSNLKDISLLKTITKLTSNYKCNEPSTEEKIRDNSTLIEKINLFKEKHRKN